MHDSKRFRPVTPGIRTDERIIITIVIVVGNNNNSITRRRLYTSARTVLTFNTNRRINMCKRTPCRRIGNRPCLPVIADAALDIHRCSAFVFVSFDARVNYNIIIVHSTSAREILFVLSLLVFFCTRVYDTSLIFRCVARRLF